jgi:UDP-glucose 4-epimerase
MMQNDNSRILVTGGAGFIGSHIVELLVKGGCRVAVIDDLSSGSRANLPQDVPLHVVDVRDADRVREVFEKERPTAVCHQAAQMSVSRSVREPAFDAEINLLGLLNVLEASVHYGVRRVVFASSGGVLYGDVDSPATETAPCAPISPYGISKWAGEKYLEFFAREHGLGAVALRYSNVYGPRQNPHGEAGVVAIFCKRYLARESAVINGDGVCIRDYVFVGDVARANLLALTQPLDAPFTRLNIGTGIGTSVTGLERALRNEYERAIGRPAPEPKFGPPRAGDLRSNLICPAAAAAQFGWKPQTDLAAGIPQTFAWFRTHSE